MEEHKTIYQGFVINGGHKIPVDVSYGSRNTLSVVSGLEPDSKPGRGFEKLVLNVAGKELEIGACRITTDPSGNDNSARLVVINDVIDFKSLFTKNKLVNLQNLAGNLPLILSHKNNVRAEFRSFITDLVYDLKVYKHFFDDIESRCEGETEEVREAVLMAVASTEGKKFSAFFMEKLDELESMISGYTREENEVHGFFLRKQVWDIISCSEFMLRTNIKPRGYAGDSEMMRMIYENTYKGDSIFSKILNKTGIEVDAAQSVRNRRVLIPQILKQVYDEFALRSSGMLKLMSVACGPAYELSDLYVTPDDTNRYHCTLLDQDEEALGEAEANLKRLEKMLNRDIQADYIQDSVRTMLSTPDVYKKWGRFDFIYSMGLFDYLTQPVAKAVTKKIYSLLEPGGRMLIGNYHVKNKSRWFMEYWLDWVLYYRTEEDMMDLLEGTDAESPSIIFEDSNCQMFIYARKPL